MFVIILKIIGSPLPDSCPSEDLITLRHNGLNSVFQREYQKITSHISRRVENTNMQRDTLRTVLLELYETSRLSHITRQEINLSMCVRCYTYELMNKICALHMFSLTALYVTPCRRLWIHSAAIMERRGYSKQKFYKLHKEITFNITKCFIDILHKVVFKYPYNICSKKQIFRFFPVNNIKILFYILSH